MNSLNDIYTNKDDVDIKSLKERKDLKIFNSKGTFLNDVITGEEKNDILLRKEPYIKLEKKKGKNFDALEKKGLPFLVSTGTTITLFKNEKKRFFFPIYLGCKRYLKELGTFGIFLGTFVCILLIILLGYFDKLLVENRVNAGYTKLIEVKEGKLGLNEIQKNINDARFDLFVSDILFFPFRVLPDQKSNSVKHVISGGRYLSTSLDKVMSLYQSIESFISEKSIHQIYFTQLFLNIYPEILQIENLLDETLYHYKAISWLPNEQLLKQKDDTIRYIEKIHSYVKLLSNNFTTFLDILGHSGRKRYLVVFQNADEIRPTGGFMGSMGLLEIYRGRIQLFQKKDVYAIEWDLKKAEYERLPAPKGINELTDTFGLRDANYYVNLRDSSNSIKFFTDNANIDLDGVVYINQNILLKLLEISGPVYFEPFGREVTGENFSELMSLTVESKIFKQGTLGTPKQVLFDFMEVFSQTLMSEGKYFDYLNVLIHEIESRDVLMWSFNEKENAFLREIGMNGQIDYTSTLDFIYPVYTSLSGNKSDRYMQRQYNVTVSPYQRCSYKVDAEIISTHDMGKKKRDAIGSLIDEYKLSSPNLLEIQGAAKNRQYVRIILPSDAKIQPQDGMEIVNYGSKMGIEFFLDTQLQETSTYKFSYSLPNLECRDYDFTLYKQPGIPEFDVNFSLDGNLYQYPQRKEDFYFELRE